MTLIGRGAQYAVTDIGDGRVRKVPHDTEEANRVIASWYAADAAPPRELAASLMQSATTACNRIRSLILLNPGVAASLGNPQFENQASYTQDRVHTLGQRLEAVSFEEGIKLLSAFAELVVRHWRYGVSDRVFNCVVNNGVTDDGRVILIDFGELAYRKDEVAGIVESQAWLTAWSYTRGLPDQYRGSYRAIMASRLTLAVLNEMWERSLGRETR